MSEYYAGMGCRCAAWSENECACAGVDWTPEEVYELRKQLKALQDAVIAFDPFDELAFSDRGGECISCEKEEYRGDIHEPECPVTKLRKVLKAQEVSDE